MKYTDNDLLNRKCFIDRMIQVTELQSQNKKSTCYAIDGKWGIGKSYVLEMYKEQLKLIRADECSENKYMIFEYNCWKYDYYEEPLLAIVATILDTFAEQNGEVDSELSAKIIGVLKEIGKSLWIKGEQYIKDKSGIDVGKIREIAEEGVGNGTKEYSDSRDFDKYLNFKENLIILRKTISELTAIKTVVLMVDELDRCLPEYTIKVLERLHHLFDGIPNMQVILSTDKKQLAQVVKKIYGADTDVEKYLEKFILFTIKLEEGSLNEKMEERFDFYLKNFDYIYNQSHAVDVEDFKSFMLEGIDTRSRIAIIEKCSLLHNLLNKEEETNDYIFMCIEVLLALIYFFEVDVKNEKGSFNINILFRRSKEIECRCALDILREKYIHAHNINEMYGYSEHGEYYIRTDDIWGVLYGCYRAVIGCKSNIWRHKVYDQSMLCTYAKNYWDLLNIIN